MRKIAHRLILQTISVLVVFSIIIAGLFGILFAKQTEDLHQEELVHRSELISETMADYFATEKSAQQANRGQGNGMGGYGAFLRFLNQIAGEEVWLVNKELKPLIRDHHQATDETGALLAQANSLVAKAYQTKQMTIDKKRTFFQLQELTVVTPILANETVSGVVVMHSQVSAIHKNQFSGYFMLLVSLIAAAIVAGLLAWRLGKRFVRPIAEMRNYVDDLANESFQGNLSIHTKDELQELGDQLSVLSQRLDKAKQAREKKEQSEKEFLSQISHELRTPIMVIKGSLTAINEGYLDTKEEKSYLQQLTNEVTGLERLVNDLLELSRLESIEFQLKKTTIDLLDCLNDAQRSYRVSFKEKNQRLEFKNELQHKQVMKGDYLRLTQAFKILLDNANKYAPEGSVITLTVRSTGQAFEIQLTNLQKESTSNPQELFDFFKRGKQTSEGGTGLGLAIARQVILRHQGEIAAESTNDSFTITILLPYL